MNTPEITTLEAEIISTIKGIPKTSLPGKGDAEWTTAVKRALMELGKKNEYSVCGFPPGCDPEWLYDMVWFRNDSSHYLREIGLVLESEWQKDPEAISYDFEKLLIAKSPIKVMVFQDFKANSVPQLWSLLERGIRTFKTEPVNEKYILAGFQNDEYEFAVKTIPA